MKDFDRTLRYRLESKCAESEGYLAQYIPILASNPSLLQRLANSGSVATTPAEELEELNLEYLEYRFCRAILADRKVVVMPTEQAEIFLRVPDSYADGLDFRLPFAQMMIQFSRPLRVNYCGMDEHVLALLLRQETITDDMARSAKASAILANAYFGGNLKVVEGREGDLFNTVLPFFADNTTRQISWMGNSFSGFVQPLGNNAIADGFRTIKNLAIACVGYINCENVYLHRECVPDKVNRKRERNGKRVIDPYYVCRIRGVQYDGDGYEVGSGAKHGHRYDVRGHFRRIAPDKVTWVRPHQRGLQHELYIPKTYVVDRGAQ